jgi:DtxR family Mn-dependent transcriptional regulator
MPNKTSLQGTAREDYLKAIYHLEHPDQGERRRVTTTELARHLGIRKPSVTSMVKRLADDGYVDYSPRRGVRLREDGRIVTMHILRRHRLLETFLVRVLGLDWSVVHDEAEVLEHHLSDRMVDAIDRVLGYPTEDPHGALIPDANAALRQRDLVPLSDLATGERGTVRELRDSEAARLRRWRELGLVPGAECRMAERHELEDVMRIEIGDETVVTGTEGVEGILVERPS